MAPPTRRRADPLLDRNAKRRIIIKQVSVPRRRRMPKGNGAEPRGSTPPGGALASGREARRIGLRVEADECSRVHEPGGLARAVGHLNA